MENIVVSKVRKYYPGFVGNKFAKKASDEDILSMVLLKTDHAAAYNMFMLPINQKIDKLNRKYGITK
ncbi:MAG: hypothetical protein V3W20_00580 [Candidatus Neomarinimicrobiota bacterium]